MAGRQLEGVVGRRAAVPHASICTDALCAGTADDERRNDLLLCHGWSGERTGAGKRAAAGKDVRLGGGAATIRQYLRAGLVDEMHFAYSPALLGRGENLLEGIDLPALGYQVNSHVMTDKAMHVMMGRSGA